MSALLLALLLVPLVGAAVCGAMASREHLDRAGKAVGLGFSVVSLVLVLICTICDAGIPRRSAK